ncbi:MULTISPECIES: FHA domain-containing protein [unclassified Pseudoclavibacter]|uniref:FHA domain-containing protein n=1 Tax=unclassified Pseudoclavibacter TaxID=2615177 RepID=UPI00130153F2|nr:MULTISPECIES: FHA domain-containing protein [unclassified Pseudoclavibacter]KAB1647156.1 FHA domain-containing protein [Pseudoclavibacter sp. CFCC 14310]KAB1662879.1 FHA domain-containing protein [Pseudoclavibacter sp. CFCC 13611]
MTNPQFPSYGSNDWTGGPSLAQQAADPATSPEQMRVIIQQDPSLSAVVAVNPSVDDALRTWLWEYGGDDVRQAMTDQYEQALQAQQTLATQATADDGFGQQEVVVEQVVQAAQAQAQTDSWYQESAPVIDSVPGFTAAQPPADGAFGTPQAPAQAFAAEQQAPFAEPQHALEPQPAAQQESPIFGGAESFGSTGFGTASDVEDDDVEKTVLVRRNHRPVSRLLLESGDSVEIEADVAILGRNPRGEFSRRDQIVRIPDSHKTISKTHAKLEWVDGGWFITDLESTNGVTLGTADDEVEITPNTATPLDGPFALGLYRMELKVDR